MQLEWARDLLAQRGESGVITVPFVKQLGAVLGRELGAGPKGGDMARWPADPRVREFPPKPSRWCRGGPPSLWQRTGQTHSQRFLHLASTGAAYD